mmetsp:Transcript_8423/g.23331  ORF Transcript_8423/g.23331 Transcript_8423/m.23331 type:complete len:209 (-) Transcript_8423:270-896(-)
MRFNFLTPIFCLFRCGCGELLYLSFMACSIAREMGGVPLPLLLLLSPDIKSSSATWRSDSSSLSSSGIVSRLEMLECWSSTPRSSSFFFLEYLLPDAAKILGRSVGKGTDRARRALTAIRVPLLLPACSEAKSIPLPDASILMADAGTRICFFLVGESRDFLLLLAEAGEDNDDDPLLLVEGGGMDRLGGEIPRCRPPRLASRWNSAV